MTNPTQITLRLSRSAGMLLVTAAAVLLLALAGAATARADLEFESVGLNLNEPTLIHPDGTPVLKADGTYVEAPFTRQAGDHPDLIFTFALKKGLDGKLVESIRDLDLDLPVGFVGNANGIPSCKTEDFIHVGGADCDMAAQIGVAEVFSEGALIKVGIFNLEHGADVPARFGFNFGGAIAVIAPRVRPGDYGITSGSLSISQAKNLEEVRATFWGVPSDPSHDSLRQHHEGSLAGEADRPSTYYKEFGLRHPEVVRRPFLTAPTSCSDQPVPFRVRGDSWENPGAFDERTLTADEDGTSFTVEGCEKLAFDPSGVARPTSREADAPSGLTVDVHVPQPQDPDGFATAHVRKVKLTLPPGMSVSPSSAVGLGACPMADIGLGTNDPPSCPQSSKLGTVQLETPLLAETLEGDVILAKQKDNPFNSLLALYIAVKGPGFYLKLPGRIDLDPQTGQLTSTFDNNPQLPFEDLHLKLSGGPRAALVTPRACGNYEAQVEFVSWASDNPVTQSIPMTFNQGCGSGFAPGLRAGSESPLGGAFAAFNLQVVRADGEPNLAKIEATLPEGLLAKLAGVPLCGDAQAASGNCPAASQVGTTSVGAGPGPLPVYVPEAGKAPTAVYLAGPYKGAPYSMVVKVPAQAGPFDLGTVVVRNALKIDPITTQASAVSDPLPQIIEGIPIAYRDVRVEVNRPEFTINPTSCKPMKVTSVLTSAAGQTATPSTGFQVTGCGELGFEPKLALQFSGKTNRSAHPALKATLRMPKGGANIAKTVVLLPETEFIDNAHISNPCTRVQFDAGACPKSSILGTATATSPLLDQPLTGPVYFRSNGGARELPDLVADLNGPIHVTVVGFIDSVKTGPETARVRTRFLGIPDAPVSKFVLKMKGGDKGLLVNNTELCKAKPRARAEFTGQNGKTSASNPLIKLGCGKSPRKR